MKIAIAGPGRSGSTFLTQLLGSWGLKVPPEVGTLHDEVQAGLENRIGFSSEYEVDKDPWLFEYISRLDRKQLELYDAFIIPIRSQYDAVISRNVQERYARSLDGELDHWLWNSWGLTPGGSISDVSVRGVSKTLEAGLWAVLESLSAHGIQPIILNFPRMAIDFDYLWQNIGLIFSSRISENDARAAFQTIADSSKVRVDSSNEKFPGVHKAELVGIIEMQRAKINNIEETILTTQKKLEQLQNHQDSVAKTLSWRITAPLRTARRVTQSLYETIRRLPR